MNKRYFFTSESVTEGHPDKMADQISDAILDGFLSEDPFARVACETMLTTGLVLVTGEITSRGHVDIAPLVRQTVADIGYTDADSGFDGTTCAVLTAIDGQSPDIALGVDKGLEAKEGRTDPFDQIGAGDQGMMFGYACRETPELMPLPISLAHRLVKRLSEVRRSSFLPYLKPDGKSQVTVEYEGIEPVRVEAVVISGQHRADTHLDKIRDDVIESVIKPIIPPELVDAKTRFYVNPTGRFVHGGPAADAGLTGRKIIVDTYGGSGRHGGGAFSGKDPTKVDRSASYAARYIAKNVIAAGLAERCEVQLAYAIGVAQPVSVMVDTFGTGLIPDDNLSVLIEQNFELRPAGIIAALDLRRPIYRTLAAYGHFGRTDLELPWERTDKAQALKAAAAQSV